MTLLLQSPSFELWWEPHRGTFRLQSPGRDLEGFVGAEVLRRGHFLKFTTESLTAGRVTQAAVEDVHGAAQEMSVHYQELHSLSLRLRIRLYNSRPFVLFQITLTNVGSEPVRVRRFFFQTTPDGFRPIEAPTGFYANGWQSWSHAGVLASDQRGILPSLILRPFIQPMMHNPKTPRSNKSGRFWSETVGAVITPREAMVAGATSLADQFAQMYADLRPGRHRLMLQSQADDVPLLPGEARSSEWFYLEWVALPNTDPLAQYAYAVARQMHVPSPKPVPVGWSSWYIFWNKVSEVDVMKNLATAALLADEVPLQTVQLDEGFQSIWGEWSERNDRFPHDLKWLADRIKGSGFLPGLWLAPLTAHPKSALVREHPEWILRNQRGRPVSPGWISNTFMRALDPTHPGVEEYLSRLTRAAVQDWGYPYLKLDFMYAGALAGQYHNPRVTRAQAMRSAFRIIRQAAGSEAYLLGCGCPLGPVIGLVDAMRIGPDTAPDWEPVVYGSHRLFRNDVSLPSLRNSLRNTATRAWMHGRWWVNDPDDLMVRDTQTRLTEDEVRSQATLMGLSGGSIILSDDLERLPPERRTIAAMLLPPLLDGMDMLDLFNKEMPEEALVPVARPWGRWRLLGLFNWEDVPVKRPLPAVLAISKRKAYHIVNFWKRQYYRIEPGAPAPTYRLPPHGCVLLGIRAISSYPHLVATTFHISQGAEVTEWRSTPEAVMMTLDIGRLSQGEVWLSLPGRPEQVTLNDQPLAEDAVSAIAPGVWSIKCHINRRGTLRIPWSNAQ